MAKVAKFRLRNDTIGIFLPMHDSDDKEHLIEIVAAFQKLFGDDYSIHTLTEEVWKSELLHGRGQEED